MPILNEFQVMENFLSSRSTARRAPPDELQDEFLEEPDPSVIVDKEIEKSVATTSGQSSGKVEIP